MGTFIETRFGIKMPPSKKALLEARLAKRLISMGFNDYTSYFKFIQTPEGLSGEYYTFADLVSTHKTEFFREWDHFKILYKKIIPRYAGGTLNMWSAACSTGEEVYSIAMTVEEFKKNRKQYIKYSVMGSDLAGGVLETALRAVYPASAAAGIPPASRTAYLMKCKDPQKKLIRIIPKLRKKVRFKMINLMDRFFDIREMMDVVFCRNVFIYFKQETQLEIIIKIARHINKKGYLIIGHTDSLISRTIPFKKIAPTIYIKV